MFNNSQNIYSKKIKRNNNILIYDFTRDVVLNKYENLFEKYNVKTPTQGLSEITKDGSVFIEESDYGRLLKFNKDKKLVFEYINRASNNKLYPLKWFRIINKIEDSLLNKMNNNYCNAK